MAKNQRFLQSRSETVSSGGALLPLVAATVADEDF